MADPTTGQEQEEQLLDEAAHLPQDELLSGSGELPDSERSLLLEAATRVLYPSMLVVSVYLLVHGLHSPGGGFSGGLVAALALVLRRLAGGTHELGVAAPPPPGVLLGTGLALVAAYAVAGLVPTDHPLAGTVLPVPLPGVSAWEVPTSLVLEVGIFVIVVGLVLDVLRVLGTEDDTWGGDQ